MDYYADVGIQILLLMMLAAGLNILFGYAGQVSMAHAAFFGLGAYFAGRLTLPAVTGDPALGLIGGAGWPLVPAVLVAVVLSAVVAVLIGLPALSRVSGEYLILMTLAFQIVATQLMQTLDEVTGGAYGLTAIPPLELFGKSFVRPVDAFWFILAATLLVMVVSFFVGESPFGRLLRGIREHETAVRAVGKGTVLHKLAAFGIAGAIAAFAGALSGAYYQYITPGSFNLDLSILVVSIVVLGGLGNLLGTVIAAVVLGSLRPIMQNVAGDDAIAWQAVIYGLALVLLVRFRPEGLVPEGVGIRRLLPRRDSGPQPAAPERAEPVPATPAADVAPAPGEPVVEVRGLSKSFGGVNAVSDVSFDLQEGIVTGLVGPNGAGKTTVFNLITNTLPADAGTVTLRGHDITNLPMEQIARLGMARSFQDGRLFVRLSALDNVAIAVPDQPGERISGLLIRPVASVRAERRVRQRAIDALGFVGLADRRHAVVGSLSFGEQKLVAIARLLATEADVLLLDEPTSGVDPAAVEDVIRVIRDLRHAGRTVCLVEHSVHMMGQLADHAIFMDQGRVIAEGTLDELMRQESLTEIYFGV